MQRLQVNKDDDEEMGVKEDDEDNDDYLGDEHAGWYLASPRARC